MSEVKFDEDGYVIGWKIISFKGNKHVMPTDEAERHFPNDCPCRPTPDAEDDTVIVHNSFDGRELFETGERKPS